MTQAGTARHFAIIGVVLILLGMVTGLCSGSMTNPRMGLSSHLAAMFGGTLLLALAAAWVHVRLPGGQDRWACGLIAYGLGANWLATLLAAIWGAGHGMMPIASGAYRAAEWQDSVVYGLLISLSLALLAGFLLALKGLLAPTRER